MKTILLIFTIFISTNIFSQKGEKNYKHIKHQFYTDEKGILYFRDDYRDETSHIIHYKATMPLGNWEKHDSLKNVIDIKTYSDLGYYSKDTNHVYYFISNSDGHTMRIVSGADAKTFRTDKDKELFYFGRDKSYLYNMGSKVDSCKPFAAIKIFKQEEGDYIYFTDGTRVYCYNEVVPGADPATFKTVYGKEWTAEDKNGWYYYIKKIQSK